VFAALLCTILFSVSVICGHRSAKLIGGTEANFWRLSTAVVFLGVWSFGFGIGVKSEAFPVFWLSGLLGIGVGDLAMFYALPRLGSRLSILLVQCLSAPMGALIEWLWLGTALNARQIACIGVILAGVALALTPGKHIQLTRRELALGILFCAISALSQAGGAVLSRKAYAVVELYGEHLDGANAAFQRVLGGLFLAGPGLMLIKRREFWTAVSAPQAAAVEAAKQKWRRVWPWILFNALAGMTLGVSCMQWALKTTPSGVVLAIIAATPIVVIPFAYFFEGERPSLPSLLGGIVAVSGVIALLSR
jgi:drug/metabolite transporter (DMT)-like permease